MIIATLRIAKVDGGDPEKLARIKVVRKSIATVLTRIPEQSLEKVRNSSASNKMNF